MKFDKLSEHQIRKAQAEGQLDDLKGAGKPLPANGDGDFAEAVGFRIMAEAGALPREIELKKEIKAHALMMQGLTDPAEKKVAMARFAQLQQDLEIQVQARRQFYNSR